MKEVDCIGCCMYRWGERNAYRVLILKRKGKRPLGIPGHGWEDNDKVDVNKIVCEGMDWINLAQDRDILWVFLNIVMNI
jgi:hypothetical protein